MPQSDTPSFGPRQSFAHALTWSFVATTAQRGIRMGVLLLLAALLAPHDFGMVSMAMAYILVIELFVAQGFAPAVIQRKNITPVQLDSLFWLMQSIGFGLALCGFAAGAWWAEVNDLPELAPVIQVLSISIIVKALTIMPRAVMVRQMEFRKLAILDSSASITAGAVSVTMALLGAGVWALVVQQLLSTGLAVVLLWNGCDWRPRLRFSWNACCEFFGFGTRVFLSQVGVDLGNLTVLALMGLFFGPVTVGLYRIVSRLTDVVLEVTARSVQVPALAHFSDLQNRPEQLRHAVLKCVRLTATLSLPMMAVLAVTGREILAVLGEAWLPAASALPVLALFGAIRAVTLITQPLLIARGQTTSAAVLVWTFGIATTVLIIVVAAFLNPTTPQTQIVAVAWVRTAAVAATFGLFSLVVVSRMCAVSRVHLLSRLVPGTAAGLATLLVGGVLTRSGMPVGLSAGWALLAAAAPAAMTAAIVLWLLDRDVQRFVAAAISPRARKRLLGASSKRPGLEGPSS